VIREELLGEKRKKNGYDIANKCYTLLMGNIGSIILSGSDFFMYFCTIKNGY